ncbi:hypothetical protein [Adlercreutzia mucosicola]|uniref:hypothetical protein n=1 Tax=Adlercreutzia mucosicola TaxID=580026 RepID=UPI0004807F14|nr:hypothetical protein [Adlercreutzia mucosicola]MCR2034070.1 hypothetical protein [Adlercreutzia mucosicola]MEB1814168.1 hypothetical protein [Adlercreutzia mucosicola]
MTEHDPQKAARDAAAAFIQSAGPEAAPTSGTAGSPAEAARAAKEAYGATEAAQAQTGQKNRTIAVVVGVVIALLVLAGVGAFLFTQGVFTKGATPEQVQRVPLSDARVIAAFDEVTMEAPDITRYAYVPQDALIGPKFTDIVVNEPVDLGAPSNQIVSCTATATAVFKNKGIEIDVPVTLPFEYSVEGETWVPGELTQGDPTAIPLASASATEIVDNRNAILTAYDPTYGEAMADATVVSTAADLTIDGGPITIDLSKSVQQKQEDGSTIDELRNCTVGMTVAWSNDQGWLVTVTDAGEIDTQTSRIPDPNAAATVAPADTSPQNLGAVNFGDTIAVAGTLEAVENTGELAKGNNYTNGAANLDAGGSVQLVLRLTRPLDMTLNGTAYHLTTMAVALGPNVTEDEKNSLIGRKADVKGPLDENFLTNWCPAGIKAMEIHVE